MMNLCSGTIMYVVIYRQQGLNKSQNSKMFVGLYPQKEENKNNCFISTKIIVQDSISVCLVLQVVVCKVAQ